MQNNEISFISSPKITKLKHGWFMRYGGVSSGDYESLNIKKGMEDPLENVQENIIRAASALKLNLRKNLQSPGSARPVKTSFLLSSEATASPHQDKTTFSSPESKPEE